MGRTIRAPNCGVPQAQGDALVALLDLEPIEVNIFRGRSPDESRQRVFGGQVAGQALVAARSEEHTSELQSHVNVVCRLLLEKKKIKSLLRARDEGVTAQLETELQCRRNEQ